MTDLPPVDADTAVGSPSADDPAGPAGRSTDAGGTREAGPLNDKPPTRRLIRSFQGRLTATILGAAVLPLTAFGLLLIVSGAIDPQVGAPLLLFIVAIAALLAVMGSYAVGADLTAPLREIAAAIERVGAGDRSRPIQIQGSDILARLADSHNRLAEDVDRRNRQLARVLSAVQAASPREGVDGLIARAAVDAAGAFDLTDATIRLVHPDEVPEDERIPGEALPVRAELRLGDERLGLLTGHLPATRTWERADQALIDLFAIEVAVAIRNAQLFGQVEQQNAQLRGLSEAKDDFLRGVSHNLQTPLTSIRAYADQLAAVTDDRRLGIISDQADRLSRMVQQLLLVSRLESGPLRPRTEVLALAPRVRRTWEALASADRPFSLVDRSVGWLAMGDGDQMDQVLWALLDNAIKYGAGAVEVELAVEEPELQLRLTVTDHGPGVARRDEGNLFGRFAQGGAGRASGGGSGLGLYVSRELMRGMGGDLVLLRAGPGRGARFRLTIPAEAALES